MMIPKNIKQLQNRSRKLQVFPIHKHALAVGSASNLAANHIVTVTFGPDGKAVHARCTCPWALNHGIGCSHVMAALEYLANTKDRTLSFWGSREDAIRQKQRTFYLTTDGKDGVWITSRAG